MNRSIPAIFDAGVFRPLKPVELAEGTQVEVQVPVQQIGDKESKADIAQQAAALAWTDLIKQTYGSCSGLGLQRPDQGDFETREPIL